MPRNFLSAWALTVLMGMSCRTLFAAEPLTVESDFEGASVSAVTIDQAARRISFMPGGDARRGWPCWWYFRVKGIAPGEILTLELHRSTATDSTPGSPLAKPLAGMWAMPAQATFSTDGKNWRHTDKGTREKEWMIYTLKPDAQSVFVAWGPPYTPATAARFIREISDKKPSATAGELCRSREGRGVPMLHVQEGERTAKQRFAVWVQARQHAWESGSSWVAQGFAEWLMSDSPDAAWLRQHAEIFIVPVMDVDNTATGNGGKDEQPHDHNRDWSDHPHWTETIAVQKWVTTLVEQGRMDVFLDLHNPGPGDPTFFFVLSPELLKEPMISLDNRFVELSYARISKIKPLIPMSNKPKSAGANYSPLWREMSANWVSQHGNPTTVSVCLETIWNCPASTTEGYRAVGANLAASVRAYLGERAGRD